MKQTSMLAVDLGASNGRVVWGRWSDSGLDCKEIHRFENVPQYYNGLMCWDIPKLVNEIATGIAKCDQNYETIGLCSWGNTFGILGENGNLLREPIHYRESKTEEGISLLYEKLGRNEMFQQTLYIPMTIQPAIVINYLKQSQPNILKNTWRILMISDLMNYLMTGKLASERTMAATSGMVDMRTNDWSIEYMKRAEIDPRWFPEIVDSHTILGPISDSFYKTNGQKPLVVAVAGHDTASASGLVSTNNKEESLYLSCGTWSCMGCSVDHPLESMEVLSYGATNDIGPDADPQVRFNHTGLWILQECQREWKKQGLSYSHAELVQLASECGEVDSIIDTEDELFFRSENMPQKIVSYLKKTGQASVNSPAEIARVVLDSLALRYKYSVNVLSHLTGIKFKSMRVFGGGSKNSLLCQLMANTTGLHIIAGPTEASTIGNFIQQGIAQGVFSDRQQALNIIDKSEFTEYMPIKNCEVKYRKALKICNWKIL